MNQKQVFLTGGTGFLGGSVLQHLLSAGYQVRALARHPDLLQPHRKLEIISGDLSDGSRLADQMRGCDAAVHTAAMVSTWARDEEDFYRVNVGGFRNVREASRAAGLKTLVYTSTFLALEPTMPPGAAENSGLTEKKWHPYQHSKALARKEAREALASGFPIVILYPGVIYGPGRKTEGNIVVQLIADFLAGKIPGILGDGSQVWSYSYIDDIARGHLLALQGACGGGEFVLGGDNVAFADFFQTLARLTGRSAPRFKIPIPIAAALGGMETLLARALGRLPKMTPATVRMMGQSWACESGKARRELGYEPRSLEEGLRATLEWMEVPIKKESRIQNPESKE
jgi:farnesol dehydrogenase